MPEPTEPTLEDVAVLLDLIDGAAEDTDFFLSAEQRENALSGALKAALQALNALLLAIGAMEVSPETLHEVGLDPHMLMIARSLHTIDAKILDYCETHRG